MGRQIHERYEQSVLLRCLGAALANRVRGLLLL
jgi:hypothetical protein